MLDNTRAVCIVFIALMLGLNEVLLYFVGTHRIGCQKCVEIPWAIAQNIGYNFRQVVDADCLYLLCWLGDVPEQVF